MSKPDPNKTHFGFQTVSPEEKTKKVADVFHSVASKYDLMNDLMSLGIHRWWKNFAVHIGDFRAGQTILDLASGTGDLTLKISEYTQHQATIFSADINESMLNVGRNRLLDKGVFHNIHFVQCDAEELSFPNNYFDRVIIGFGLRNVTAKEKALQSIYRVLKPGGRLLILEFSAPTSPLLKKMYDTYSFKLLPWLGEKIANDVTSYRYLAESIRMHPNQQALISMMNAAGFEDCDFHNLTGGIVALHRGYKY
jgi:demethylmenaquinone methyltransferase/2-methoxy-6-polyprenyl-1,4-benzoquinol methylase